MRTDREFDLVIEHDQWSVSFTPQSFLGPSSNFRRLAGGRDFQSGTGGLDMKETYISIDEYCQFQFSVWKKRGEGGDLLTSGSGP